MRSAPGVRSGLSHEDSLDFFRAMAAGQLPFVVAEGGGGPAGARYVCGFLGCEARPFNPLLGALPPLIRTRRGIGASGGLLDRLIELTLAEVSARRPGAECVRLRLSELMFVEVVRCYIETLTPEHTGWLAGLRDPAVGRAVALLHGNPARGWTIGELARETGVSRSVLAARFMRLIGCPPMQYLTRWRVQLAARLLADGAGQGRNRRAGSRLRVRGGVQSGFQEAHGCFASRVARRPAQITRDSATRLNVRFSIRLRPQSRAGNDS